MKKAFLFLVILLMMSATLTAQTDSAKFELNGYVDTYYATYSTVLLPNEIQPYSTTSPRDNRFGINIAQIGATYNAEAVRGAITLHYGDIAQATWSEAFQPIQEAWVGIQLADDVWLDAGFFTTHIGTESFLPKNNYLSSTTVATFNEPFFQSGMQLSYEKNEKLTAQLHLVSGYNFFLDVNDAKSVGVLLSYQFNPKLLLAYSNLYGRESLDGAVTQMRFYQNFYANWDPVSKLSVVIGGDLGTQTNSKLERANESAWMYNALATVRYRWTDKLRSTIRYEVFNDPNGFISGVVTDTGGGQQGLHLDGWTIGLEYAPTNHSYLRAETRWITAEEDLKIFNDKNGATNIRTAFMITMGFHFNKRVNRYIKQKPKQ